MWIARLGGISDADAHDLLSADEHERRRRIVVDRRARNWARSRAILRELAGRYLEADPRSLRFRAGARGKPALTGDPRGLRFSASHCEELALYAFARHREVGVDLQTRVRRRYLVPIARRAFGPERAAELARLDRGARRAAFLTDWVRHEAIAKCRGWGLAGPPGPEQDDPWTITLPVGPWALAVAGAPVEVCCWSRTSADAPALEDPDDDRLGEGFTFDHDGQKHVGAVSLP